MAVAPVVPRADWPDTPHGLKVLFDVKSLKTVTLNDSDKEC